MRSLRPASGKVVNPTMECILYGIGSSYLGDVLDSIDRLGWTVRGYVSNHPDTPRLDHLSPIALSDDIEPTWLAMPVVFPLITPGHRQRLEAETIARGFRVFATLIDPTAVISPRSSFAPGALINSGVLVGANTRAGRFTVLNRGASVGHNVVLDDFVTLGPGAIVCGGCRLQKGVFIGAGAIVTPDVTVGANCVIGAGAVVVKDVPGRSVVVGNPGAIVREGVRGYNGVSVE